MAVAIRREYPEHEKLKAVVDHSRICGEFLEWLTGDEGKVVLCETVDTVANRIEDDDDRDDFKDHLSIGETYLMICETQEQLLARFFGIDLKKLSDEKDQMVEELRQAQRL